MLRGRTDGQGCSLRRVWTSGKRAGASRRGSGVPASEAAAAVAAPVARALTGPGLHLLMARCSMLVVSAMSQHSACRLTQPHRMSSHSLYHEQKVCCRCHMLMVRFKRYVPMMCFSIMSNVRWVVKCVGNLPCRLSSAWTRRSTRSNPWSAATQTCAIAVVVAGGHIAHITDGLVWHISGTYQECLHVGISVGSRVLH